MPRRCYSTRGNFSAAQAVLSAMLVLHLAATAGQGATLERLPPTAPTLVPTETADVETPVREGEAISAETKAEPAQEPEASPVVPAEAGEAPPTVPEAGTMAPQFPGEPAEGKVIIEAKEVRIEEGVLHGRGNVVIRSTQYTLRAEEAELDAAREWARLRGAVTLQGKYITTMGRSVRANLKTGEWHLEEGVSAVIEPEYFVAEQVTDRLYLGASEAESPSEQGPITLTGGRVTSCNLEKPHYLISARRVEIRSGKKVIAERPGFYLLGKRVLELPFRLVMSLDERKNRYLPLVGQNEVEGFYAKFAFAYLLGALGDGAIRLNLTQKRGVALGFDHTLDSKSQQGTIGLMFEPSEGSLTSRISHRYRISEAWTSDLTGSYESNTGYFGNTTNLASSLLLSRRTSGGQMQIGYQQSRYGGGLWSSRRSTQTFSQRQRWGKDGDWYLQGTLEDFSYGSGAPRQRNLDARLQMNRRARAMDFSLLAGKLFELDLPAGQQRRYALNRLPALSIRSDSRRLGNYRLLGRVPFEAELTLGEFEQQPDDFSVFRSGLDLRLGGNRQQWGKRIQARVGGRFLQAFYSDGSAQYILAGDLDLEHDLGNDWQARFRYNHQERQGFAPISIDYGGKADDFYLQLVQARTDRSRIEVSTGYDLVGSFWQDLWLRAEYMPSRRTKLSLQTGYSIEQASLRPLALIWTTVRKPDFFMTLATEYDPSGGGLTRATTEIDWRLSRLWRVALVSGYSGYSKSLDTLDIQVQRDLHCFIGTLTYSKALDQIMFGLGIKAFPAPEQIIGIGRGGQQFQSLPGQYF